nr:hypothetical protein [Tanacetum cinerariifolium]
MAAAVSSKMGGSIFLVGSFAANGACGTIIITTLPSWQPPSAARWGVLFFWLVRSQQMVRMVLGFKYDGFGFGVNSPKGVFVSRDSSPKQGVTYTEVSSPFEDLSDIGSPRADDHEHLELPGMLEDPYVEVALQAPPSPDYILGPEEPEQAPPLPDYVPGPEHADDEEDDDEDPEEDPVDYPADGRDDGDDEEGSSEDNEDDDMDIEADEEEEEEQPAPVDSLVVALPAADQAPSAEETEPFETDESAATPPPHLAYRMIARISIPTPVPVPAWSDSEAASTSHSLPLPSPFILSPAILDAPSSGIPPPLPITAPISSPPLKLPSASRKEDTPEVTLPPRKRLGIALSPGYEVGESSSSAAARSARCLRADYGFVAAIDREIRRDLEREVGSGITDSWDEIVETLQGAPVSTDTELGGYMREFETRVRDRREHAYTRHLMETEARLSREAWVRSMDVSDLARDEVMSLRTIVLGQMTKIRELYTADRRRQIVTSEMLRANHRRFAKIRGLRTADRTRQQQLIQTLIVMQSLQRQVTLLQEQVTTLQGQVTALQGQMIALQGQVTALQRQQGPAGGPIQSELPEEAGSST